MSDKESGFIRSVSAPPVPGFAASEKGSVRILCDEIGFPFDRRLERSEVLVAFVRELVNEVAETRHIAEQIHRAAGSPAPSSGSAEVLALTELMLNADSDEARTQAAASVHEACDALNPDEAYPTDHLIDMLSSCASAIRFGLESPCQSRHAAHAAGHVWRRTYGVSRHDRHTSEWQKDWARGKLTSALISLPLPPAQPGTSAGNEPASEPKTPPSGTVRT